jgi:quinol-cytochrome oxidoreductase complex cytochrome b subunit
VVRGIHFWAAQGMVVIVFIHLLRVIFTGAFTSPRRFNYFIGLGLLVLTLLLDFTGYVLRWDEGIRWALMVGTNLLKTIPVLGEGLYALVIGGDQPGLATLTRFYAWHIFGLTFGMMVLVVWHVFRVRRDGGISAPSPSARNDQQRITRFELAGREVLAMLVLSFVLILAGTLLPPPLAAPIYDSGTSSITETRAPWFFLWIQSLLRYGNAFWMGIAVPLGMLILLSIIPFIIKRIPEEQKGRWFQRSGRAAQAIAILIVIGWLILTIIELKA